MAFNKVTLENFRTFLDSSFDFSPKTVVVGGNGIGKSTLIEAIRLLSVGKSFRTHRLDELVNFDQSFFRLQAQVDKDSKVELFFGQPFADYPDKERRLTFNGQETNWLEFFGKLPTVIFSPEDVEIITSGPQVRRRYFDGILWQVDSQFRSNSLELSRVLQERAKLLFLLKINRAGRAELMPWNELLGRLTKTIRKRRGEYLAYLNKSLADKKFQRLNELVVETSYLTEEADPEALEREEIRKTQNLWGPHRDEIEIRLNDQPARKYASRGQARTVVMLMKIIEAHFLAEKLGKHPTILLDDLFSELDEKNTGFFLERLGNDSQIIATAVTANKLIKDWRVINL
ncbi:MAG TPA: DNA replication and repair protein RecF [Candidatus Saccharimonadales bacterium]|nr:DNA replication and repair protein RecF [Candidatus Saccharimonadales bacterium]